jgi:hypothetical protein
VQLIEEMTYRETIVGPWGPTSGSPLGARMLWSVPEATIKGPRVNLSLAMPGADWIQMGSDGVRLPDQRLVFSNEDNAVVLLRYEVAVIRENPSFLSASEAGKETGFEDQYVRISPQFETGVPELAWPTDTLWIGEGRLAGQQRIEYCIYRVE